MTPSTMAYSSRFCINALTIYLRKELNRKVQNTKKSFENTLIHITPLKIQQDNVQFNVHPKHLTSHFQMNEIFTHGITAKTRQEFTVDLISAQCILYQQSEISMEQVIEVLEATHKRPHFLITSVPRSSWFVERLIQTSSPPKAYRHT